MHKTTILSIIDLKYCCSSTKRSPSIPNFNKNQHAYLKIKSGRVAWWIIVCKKKTKNKNKFWSYGHNYTLFLISAFKLTFSVHMSGKKNKPSLTSSIYPCAIFYTECPSAYSRRTCKPRINVIIVRSICLCLIFHVFYPCAVHYWLLVVSTGNVLFQDQTNRKGFIFHSYYQYPLWAFR